MSSVINVEEDTIGMRSKNPRPLMSQLSLHLMISFHQLQNQENALCPVPLLWNYLYHQLQNPTHTVFYAKDLVLSLSMFHPKQDFLHFFTMKLSFLLEAVVVRFIFMKICSQMKPYPLWDAQMTILFSIGLQYWIFWKTWGLQHCTMKHQELTLMMKKFLVKQIKSTLLE